MGEIVNLRRARKRRVVEAAAAEAAVNRVTFGVSKQAKNRAKAERLQADSRLESHRRENLSNDDA
jgi:hypothetical protein